MTPLKVGIIVSVVIIIIALALGLGLGLGLKKTGTPTDFNPTKLSSSTNTSDTNFARSLSTNNNSLIQNTRICVDWSGSKLFDYSVTIENIIPTVIINSFGILSNCTQVTYDLTNGTITPTVPSTYLQDCNNKTLTKFIMNNKLVALQVTGNKSEFTDSKLLEVSENILNYYNNINYVVYIAHGPTDTNDINSPHAVMFYILDHTKFIKGPETMKVNGLRLILAGKSNVLTYIDNMCN